MSRTHPPPPWSNQPLDLSYGNPDSTGEHHQCAFGVPRHHELTPDHIITRQTVLIT